jgi:lipopolysaccharide transport system permease protein
MLSAAVRHRHLLWQFTRRDVVGRYRGSLLGMGWLLLSPLLLLGAFTLVFYGFFSMKWPVSATGAAQMDFALQVFVGLILFNWSAEVINRAPVLVTGQPNLVTKVVFPLPLLPVSAVLSGAFQALVSLLLLMVVTTFLVGASVTWLALPLLLVPFSLLLMGVALCTSLLMFLSPVFYPLEQVPERWHDLYLANPLALMIIETREVLYLNTWPSLQAVATLSLEALVLGLSGLWIFRRLRGGFADVL